MLGVAVGTTVFACGGDDGGGGGGTPDAKVFMDGKVFMDAPGGGGLTGLGQKCGSGQPACPTNAPDCIALGLGGGSASTSYCTPHCLDGGSGTTNAQGQLTSTTPAPDNSKCTGAYTGGAVGMPACGVILSTTPMDNPLKANTTYTAIALGCIIQCSSGMMCPTGTSAKMAGTACFCFPN